MVASLLPRLRGRWIGAERRDGGGERTPRAEGLMPPAA